MALKLKKPASTYNEDSIDVLRGLEMVRKKPGMYVGGTDEYGAFVSFKEIADNAFDEAVAGHNDFVGVDIGKGALPVIAIWDKGRGIPVGLNKKTNQSTLTTIFTELHSGGKLSAEGTAYKASAGTHGIGAAAANALSEYLEVWTFREGRWYYQRFERGVPVTKVLKTVPCPKKLNSGTYIRFKLDKKIFGDTILNVETIKEWLDLKAYLHKGTKVKFVYNGESTTKVSEGLGEYLETTIADLKVEALGKPFILSIEDELDIALQWTSYSDDDRLTSYVSGNKTSQGGTHVTGLMKALNESLAPYKGKRSVFKPSDLSLGLIGILNYYTSSPEFSSQSKERLSSKATEAEVYQATLGPLTKFWDKNKGLAKSIIARANEMKKASEAFKAAKKSLSSLNEREAKVVASKNMISCYETKPELCELYLVEGDSASGTIDEARDEDRQAILCLGGKILNVYRADAAKVFANKGVQEILRSIGFNGKDNWMKDIKFGRIMMLTDADEDGYHIALLLISLFQKFMPELFEQGRVFKVDAPLFAAMSGNKQVHGATIQDIKERFPNAKDFKRFKGWGAASSALLNEVAMDPQTRKLIKITPIEGKKALAHFKGLVEKETEGRKELLGILEE